MSEPIKTDQNSIFIQAQPGTQSYFLGDCPTLENIPNPGIDTSLIICPDGNQGYVIRGETTTPPDKITFDVNLLYETAADTLDDIVCPFTLYVLSRCGGKSGVFAGWNRAAAVGHCRVTNNTAGPFANRGESMTGEITRSISAWWPRMDYFNMTLSRVTTTEAYALNSIASVARVQCAGNCGSQSDQACDTLIAGADAQAGVATANLLVSTNGGNTWAAAAADPFGVNTENVMSVRAFQHGATGTRWLAVRSTNAAVPLECSYSDNSGAAWTEVAIGATNTEAAYGDASLCVIDEEHIWVATTLGNVYKSTDAGLTWTIQGSASVASGAASIAAIHFIDKEVGWFVGSAGDVVARTTDGGANWTAVTASGAGAGLRSVWGFDQYRAVVGSSNGQLWMTFNGGTTWTRYTDFSTNGVGAVLNLKFYDAYCGFMVHNDAGPLGYLSRTIDGGYHWDVENYVNNDQLNAVVVCDRNRAHVVGEVVDAGTAFIGTCDRARSGI